MANNERRKLMGYLDNFMNNDDHALEAAYEAYGFRDEYDKNKELEAYEEYKKNLEY